MTALRNVFDSPSSYALAVAAIAVSAIAYVMALPVDVLEIDQAQYAWISLEMVDGGNWLEITCRGRDYLDKPPLLFWSTGLSYLLFGASNAASRIPQLAVLALGIVSTYQLGKRLYDARVGVLAALFIAWTQAFFHMGIDVRTDGMLTGMVAFALWQLVEFDQTNRLRHLVLGAIGVGLAMLGKGPLGLMAPALAFGVDMILRRRWRALFRWQWLLVPGIAVLVLSPMIWGLYTQHGSKGPEFFFWTQSFGRITGENRFENETSIFYFVHTSAWAFLPWTVLLFGAVGRGFVRAFRAIRKPAEAPELMMWGAVVMTLAGLSASQYKLPHYCYVVAAPAMILSASFLVDLLDTKFWRAVQGVQWLVWGLGWAVLLFGVGYVFAPTPAWLWVALAVLAIATTVSLFRETGLVRYVLASGFTILAINVGINGHVFPRLLEYQSTSYAGRDLKKARVPEGRVYQLHRGRGFALDFNWGHTAPSLRTAEQVREIVSAKGEIWLLASTDWKPKLEALGLETEVLSEYADFPVSRVTPKFMDPKRREASLRHRYLMRVR